MIVQTKRKNKRRTNTSKKLIKLIGKHNGICVYCKQPVMRILDAIHLGYEYDAYYIYHPKYLLGIASVDHIKRRADGGSNKLRNLTLSCINCNVEKEVSFFRKCKICKRCNDPFLMGISGGAKLCDFCHSIKWNGTNYQIMYMGRS